MVACGVPGRRRCRVLWGLLDLRPVARLRHPAELRALLHKAAGLAGSNLTIRMIRTVPTGEVVGWISVGVYGVPAES